MQKAEGLETENFLYEQNGNENLEVDAAEKAYLEHISKNDEDENSSKNILAKTDKELFNILEKGDPYKQLEIVEQNLEDNE